MQNEIKILGYKRRTHGNIYKELNNSDIWFVIEFLYDDVLYYKEVLTYENTVKELNKLKGIKDNLKITDLRFCTLWDCTWCNGKYGYYGKKIYN